MVDDVKGAFITNIGNGRVEFVESLFSPTPTDSADVDHQTDTFIPPPLELNKAIEVATATCYTVGDNFPLGEHWDVITVTYESSITDVLVL